jgi:thioredoxin-dependent peroxiredoxin
MHYNQSACGAATEGRISLHSALTKMLRNIALMSYLLKETSFASRYIGGNENRCWIIGIGGWVLRFTNRFSLSTIEEKTMVLEVGKPFPKFALPNQDGEELKLDDYKGKWVVVYIYPKDDTPGCTIQGKSFTATKEEFDAANIKVLGVSEDGVDSHKAFCNKFGFTIDLLADTDHELLKAVGAEQTEFNGVKYWKRTSFVINPEGTVAKVYESVKADGHERVLLEDIKALQTA